MAVVQELKLSNETYKDLYERQIEENEYLKKFIGKSTTSKIAEIERENEILRLENATLKGQVSEKDKHIESLRIETDKRIEQAVRIAKQEKDKEYATKLEDKGKNERRKVRDKEVKPLENKIEQQVQEIDRLQDMHNETMNKLEQVLNELSTNTEITKQVLELVKNLVENGEPKNKIVEAIDNAIEQVNTKKVKSRVELEQEDREIIQLLLSGKTDTEVANIYYSHLNDIEVRRTQLSKRKARKRFKDIAAELGYKTSR